MSNFKYGSDGIKWTPAVRVIKYSPETTAEIANFLGKRADEITGGDLRNLEKFHGLVADDEAYAKGNLLTTAGLNAITNLIIGGGGQAFNNSRAVIGVGASSPTASITDAALAANTGSAWHQGADASNPTQANGVITCNSTFTSSNGNFAWNEWGWFTVTSAITPSATLASVGTAPIMLNHKVQGLGTKVIGATWTLQATITLQ